MGQESNTITSDSDHAVACSTRTATTSHLAGRSATSAGRRHDYIEMRLMRQVLPTGRVEDSLFRMAA